jgi:ABC-type glycerol-3-phosphate transport system substrate-binding protein
MHALFIVALASCALVAGCGGSSHKTTTTPPKPAASTKTTTTTTAASTTPASTTPSASSLAAAAAECKAELASNKTLSASGKAELSTICNDLSSGNIVALKSLEARYCATILASLPKADQAAAAAECKSL